MKQLFCALLLSMTIVACTNKATGNRFSESALGTVDESQTQIVVYRPNTFVGSANWDVPLLHLDGKAQGPIRINGFNVFSVEPGEHHLKTTEVLFGGDTENTRGEVRLSMEQGATAYLRYEETIEGMAVLPVSIGTIIIYAGAYSFHLVPEDIALNELVDTKHLAVPSQ
ncbi:MAG: DUF2846 domain-containing protein [Rhodobiaceae bacterium]|nr:DUF2846 domain-containing protein [Rhodobiaceae bacterium]